MELGTFELALPEQTILHEIADKSLKQKDIAQTYALAIQVHFGGREVDFERINKAIIERWSVSGLERIKRLAWSGKAFEGIPS